MFHYLNFAQSYVNVQHWVLKFFKGNVSKILDFRQRKQKWTENAQARRERNRKSARESRLRKKNFVQNLEDKVTNPF